MSVSDYYKNLPKKRMSAGVYFFNKQGQLLLVKPIYKDHWNIPGGVVDEGESPRQGCIREIKEELGLNFQQLSLICIDYVSKYEEKDESLHFIFYGGVLSEAQIIKIKLPKEELSEYRFININEAPSFLSKHSGHRTLSSLDALKKNIAVYLEDGQLIK